MDIREVRHQSNPRNEPQDRDPTPQSLCPDCSSTLLDGDRFCQECGARVTANRAKKHAELGRGREAQFTANILCINCGAKNSPVSVDCNFCKKALVPDSGDGTVRKTFLRDFMVQEKPQRRRFGKNTAERLPVLTASKIPTLPANLGSFPTNLGTLSAKAKGTAGDAKDATERSAAVTTKQRIPRAFASSSAGIVPADNQTEDDLEFLFSSTSDASDQWKPESKHDRIAAEKLAYERTQRLDPSFGKLIVESGGDGFSLTAVQMAAEAFFERIPVPILLFVASMIIIFTTIHLTTVWQKQEQRLAALDKLASHAEDDMKAYKLDDAVIAMTELEKTESGNLPPRARSVLNQSLWLRAYAYATKNRYDLALEDMKRVTPAFNAFADASEKLDEYKEEIHFHPEYGKNLSRPEIGPPDAVSSSLTEEETSKAKADRSSDKMKRSPKQKGTTDAGQSQPEPAAQIRARADVPARPSNIPASWADIPTRPADMQARPANRQARPANPPRERVVERVPEPRREQGNDDKQLRKNALADNGEVKEGKMSSGALQASDSKRYSNLLIKYFSEAHDSEPPSFEEWQSSGKKDF